MKQNIRTIKKKINDKIHFTPRRIAFAVSVIVVIVGVVALLVNKDHLLGPNSEFEESEIGVDSTSENTEQDAQPTEGEPASSEQTEPSPEGEDNSQQTRPNPNDLDHLTGGFSATQVEGDDYMIQVTVDQSLEYSGKCEFTVKHDDLEFTGVAITEPGPSGSTCSFYGPLHDMPSGKWQVTVKISGNDKEGVITKEIDI